IGVLLWLASTLVCVALGASAWWTLKSLKLVNSSYSSAYNAGTYAIAFVVLTIASTTALHTLCRRTVEAEDLAVGGLFWDLFLRVVTSWYVPGASFLFTVPLAFGLVSLAVAFRFDRGAGQPYAVRLCCALPAVFLFTLLIAVMIINLEGDPW